VAKDVAGRARLFTDDENLVSVIVLLEALDLKTTALEKWASQGGPVTGQHDD
jgi:hypothetical protein